jgi:SAM-dependent methyltransferase
MPRVTAYEKIGVGYSSSRREDPRIMAAVLRALSGTSSVVNVGAGTGSYEPRDRFVVAVEPSTRMIGQRDPAAAPVVRGVAESLPLCEDAVDAALAVLTLHHWVDQPGACRELRRVARSRVVILTFDPDHEGFWLTQDYFPRFREEDKACFPTPARVAALLGGRAEIEPVPVPRDCSDGFLGAFWARPRAYLDPGVRRGISSFAASDPADLADGLRRLEADLDCGRWREVHGAALEHVDAIDLGYRLVSTDHAQEG